MASTIILSDNGVSSGTNGLKTTGGNDGTLTLQTTTSGGTATTAATIDTSQNVNFVNGVNMPNTFGFKNRIINGAMMIDQRNGGAVSSGYSVDRWACFNNITAKATLQKSSTAPAGFVSSLLITSTSAYTVGAGEVAGTIQQIEGLNVADLAWGTANAQSVTLSFWARSSLTGQFGGALRNADGSRSYPFAFTINSANTFEYKTVQVSGPTSGTWATDNTAGIGLVFSAGAGSSLKGTAGVWSTSSLADATGSNSLVATNGATLYITGVQLEKGTQATSFDFRSYGTELALCQRYCLLLSNQSGTELGIGGFYGATDLRVPVFLKQSMRITPSITAPSGAGSYSAYFNGTAINGSTLLVDGSSSISYVELQLATATSAVSGVVSLLRTNNSGTVYLSAEL